MRIINQLRYHQGYISNQFKVKWLTNANVTIHSTEAESVLASKGIEVVDIKNAVRPALQEEPYTPLVEEVFIPEEKPLCYVFKNSFYPLSHTDQCKVITNSILFDCLPDAILNKVEETNAEEEKLLEKLLLRSNLLDAEQQKLPREIDVHRCPGYKMPRTYGIPKMKKLHSLVQHMLLATEMNSPSKDMKHIFKQMPSKVALQHADNIVQMNHQCDFLVCSKEPLKPVVESDEVATYDNTPHPDLYPISPFIHVETSTNYDLTDEYALSGIPLKPHTIFIAYSPHYTKPRIIVPEQWYGMTMVYAFSFAASYAKERDKGVMGDLKEPVTVNIVHSNGKLFHTGIFQLNTLDLTSDRRNLFWHEPLTSMYKDVRYDYSKPVLEGLNARPYQLLKALLS